MEGSDLRYVEGMSREWQRIKGCSLRMGDRLRSKWEMRREFKSGSVDRGGRA